MPARPRIVTAVALGFGLGILAFSIEGAMVLRQSAIGLNIDTEGPFAALIQAVRPHVPPLLARIALAYAAAGAVAGLFAGLAARMLGLKSALSAWALYLVNFAALVALVVWDRAIVRPALFDDLAWFRPVLGWLVAHGEPWHPRVAAAVLFCVLLAVGLARTQVGRTPLLSRLRFAVAVAAIAAFGTLIWSHAFPRSSRPGDVARAEPANASGSKLVVLIGIDAFRPDRLTAFGGDGSVAPNLEALVGESTLFTNAWTPIAQTEPAWRALLTARWPNRTGVRYPLTAESRWVPAPTFSGALANAGWSTSFTTDCSRFNFQPPSAGFNQRHQPPRGAVNFVLEKLRFRLLGTFADNDLGARWLPEMMENRALAGLYDPVGYAQRLAQRIVEDAKAGSTFAAFHSTAAHFPGDPVYPFVRAKVRADAPLERRVRMFFSPISGATAGANAQWTQRDAEALYDELLMMADAQVAIVVRELKRAGLYDDATIILFSDHGESFHEDHPELAGATSVHGARISDLENHILLSVKLPKGSSAPARVDELVRLIDLGPTILELAGVTTLPEADGVSLMPLLRGESLPEPLVLYAETGFTHASPSAFDPGHLAVAPRSFDIYRVRPDGVVEINDATHEAILREKDFGAFDGERWIIRSPREDGTVAEVCRGACPSPSRLTAFLDGATDTPTARVGAATAPAKTTAAP